MILVYQAYGREDVIRQTQFSIVSLLSVLSKESPIQIWVYTDNKPLFSDYFMGLAEVDKTQATQPAHANQAASAAQVTQTHARLRFIEVNSAQIQKWRGAINFVHRVKVEVLLDAAKQFEGSLFYVDGDTYFREDPTSLFQQVSDSHSLMHIAENNIDAGRDPLSRKISKFLKKNTFDVGDGELVQMSANTVMWNAGAIGISQKNKALLKKVLALTDAMHVLYPKHVMEQLAFSYYLQNHSQIFSGDNVIGHYWDQKEQFQQAIDEFLSQNSNWSQAEKSYAQFKWPAPPAPENLTAQRGGWFSKLFR